MNILMPEEKRLVPSIKNKLGNNQSTICNVLNFLGTPENTFEGLLSYLSNEISTSLDIAKKNQSYPSPHDKSLQIQFKQLSLLTEDEGKVLERLGKCIVSKGLIVKDQVECIFFNDDK